MRTQIIAGVLSQATSSMTNFGFGLYLLRTLEVRDFGLYNIGFAALLFFGSLLHGFLFVQMTVITPTFSAAHQRNFVARVEIILFLISLAAFALALLAVFGIRISAPTTEYPKLILATIAMCIAFGLKEFHTRLAFNEGRGLDAVAIHGILAITLLAAISGFSLSGRQIDVTVAMSLYTIAHFIGFLYGQIRSRLRLTGHRWDEIESACKHVWSGGKWETMTSVVMSLRNQAHTIVVGAIIGPAGVAKLNASRLLVAPAMMSIPVLSQIMLAHMARAREMEGIFGIQSIRRQFVLALGLFAAAYSALLLTAYPFLSDLLFGGKYQDMFWLTVLWCSFSLSWVIRASYSSAIQSLREFRSITVINTIGSVIALTVAYIMTLQFGLHGAVLGIVIGDLFVAIVLRHALVRGLRPQS